MGKSGVLVQDGCNICSPLSIWFLLILRFCEAVIESVHYTDTSTLHAVASTATSFLPTASYRALQSAAKIKGVDVEGQPGSGRTVSPAMLVEVWCKNIFAFFLQNCQ